MAYGFNDNKSKSNVICGDATSYGTYVNIGSGGTSSFGGKDSDFRGLLVVRVQDYKPTEGSQTYVFETVCIPTNIIPSVSGTFVIWYKEGIELTALWVQNTDQTWDIQISVTGGMVDIDEWIVG